MEHYLVDEDAGLIRLLTPPFDRTPNDPGYIRGYLPGVRENGGQYTHGVLWAVRALAANGRTERAARLLEMLSPATRGGTPANAARYMVEPYVIAADVYGVEPHVGRGGWTWYTGSAGWMFRIALESVLGVDVHEGRELRLTPCIPDDWPAFRVRLRLPEGTMYVIEVSRGAREITLDGAEGRANGGTLIVPLLRDGREHHVQASIPLGDSARRDG
jgi:cyclic beta-1,2-glucan synthetase